MEDNTRPEESWLLLPVAEEQTACRQQPRLAASVGLQRGRLVPAAPKTLQDGQRHREDGLPRPGCEPKLTDRP